MTESPPIRVLLIEDNAGDARLIRELLDGGGPGRFRLLHASRLQDARPLLPETDILLCDLSLPDASGFDTLRQIREMSPGIPLVVLTGTEDETLAIKAVQEGAQDYLVKGHVDRPLLVRSIQYALERHRILEEVQTLNTRMERLALIDPLTEILNRRGFERALTQETQRARRTGPDLVVLLVDLDDFKIVNDTLGHAVGDVVLKEVAKALRASLRPTDPVARIGGDEFMILLPETRLAEGLKTAERVRLAASSSMLEVTSGAVKVTASIGVAMVPSDPPTIDDLLSQTHLALRHCKRSGKNQVCALEEHASDSLGDIVAALRHGTGFSVVSQPLYRLRDESLIGYEFLSRGPDGPFHMPGDFFRASFENNILTLVDRRCFRMCVTAAVKRAPPTRSHINLFPSTMLDIPPAQLVEVFPTHLPNGNFCLEISEQQLIGDPSYLLAPIRALRDRGILIAIDDVGFGRSCLESLILLQPDIVKIDRKRIQSVGTDASQSTLLQRILSVARALDAEVVAEGIETREDLEELRRLEVPYGQGFLWGQPS